MKKNNSIAIIVMNYNGRDLLDESLSSLLKQTSKNTTVYLADGASTDDSVSYVAKKYPKVKIITSDTNLGIAGQSNESTKHLKEDYFVFVSNDMKFDKNCVAELYKTITKIPQIGICTAVLLRHDKDPIVNDYIIDNAGFDLDIFGFIEPKYTNKKLSQIPRQTFEVFASCGGCFIIKRKLFKQLGGFDESFWALSEDMDISWRCRLLGYDVYTQPKAFLYHHISPTLSKLKKYKTRYLSERNNLTMLLKNYSSLSLLIILPLYLIHEFIEILYHTIIGHDPKLSFSVIRGLFYNLQKLPQTLPKRNTVQQTRKISDLNIFSKLNKTSFKIKIVLGFFK